MQIAAANHLQEKVKKTVEGRAKLGIDAFAQALLGIPKTLAENSGYDAQQAAAFSAVPCPLLTSSVSATSDSLDADSTGVRQPAQAAQQRATYKTLAHLDLRAGPSVVLYVAAPA